MAKAKSSLHHVAAKALEANKGSQAVSVAPSLKDGRPIAAVTLVKDDNFKTIVGLRTHQEILRLPGTALPGEVVET
jgi:hypothetical protein